MKYVSFKALHERSAIAERAADKRALRLYCYLAIAALDGLAQVIGFAAAGELRFANPLYPVVISWVVTIVPLFWLLNAYSYSAPILKDYRRGLSTALFALVGAVVAALFLAFALRAAVSTSRLFLVAGVIASGMVLVFFRMMFARVTSRIFGASAMSHVLVVDGVDIPHPRHFHILSTEAWGNAMEFDNPYVLDRLARSLQGVDSVTVACPPERRTSWAMALKGINVRAELTMPELDALGTVGAHHVAGMATVLVSSGPLSVREQLLKRAMDLSIAGAALVFLAPLMIAVAVAVRLDSRGPVLFRQQRVGLGNQLFSVLKFRSMRMEQSDTAGTRSTARDDDRITRVGRFIRTTSIDELPQLFNVLRGDMSVVGPRPHALGSLAGDKLFWEVDARYNHRHACKPGVTGLAQVRGFRGATHRQEDLVNRLQADLEYLHGWSIWRDLTILLSTLRVVVHRNAY